MIGQLSYTKSGTITKVNDPQSAYQPSQEVRDLTFLVKQDYLIGDNNLTQPFEEFNNLSLLGRMNEDQKAWLSWNAGGFNDSENDWRWTGVRPITRNKIISTAAHLTSQLLVPQISAQNEKDEEDREAGYVMGDLIEYNIEHSNYETAFLFGVVSALVNPVTYFKVDYCQAMQEAWAEGKKEKVVDDILSGFQHSLIPADEILIGNPYVFDLQRQPFLIQRRKISFDEAQALYGEHENFIYVKPGVKALYSDQDGLFYDVDDDNDVLVEETTYYNRRSDTQVCFINGIYMGDVNPSYNPIKHRSNKNKPKYQFVKMGAEPIDAMRFWAYKSLVAKMSNDQELTDRMWQMAMDGSFLATFPPVITVGAGKIDKSVIGPAVVTDIQANAQINPLNIADPTSAFVALREAERSLSESSQDTQMEGKSSDIPQTARQSILIQQNAETNLGIMGKMIGNAVKEIGELVVDDILRYQTIGEMGELLGGLPKMNYRTFILQNKVKDGKNNTEVIKFTDRLSNSYMSKEDKDMEEMEMWTKAGDNKHIWEVNPGLFARMDYLVSVDYEQMTKKNTAFEKAFKLETYDRSIASPYVDQELITRDFLLEPLVGGDAEKYLKKAVMGVMPATAPSGNKNDLPASMMKSGAMEKAPMVG